MKTETEPLVRATGLTKRFGELTAVDEVDFEIQPGEVVGFLGPNGAGKTTTIRMMTCSSPLTSGSLKVFGLEVNRSPRQIKAQLGIVPQDNNYDPDMSVFENLVVYGWYFGLDSGATKQRARELLEFVQLTDKAGRQVDELSGGMKRRLIVARGLINSPRLLVLDEPTTGLDPQARRLIWERLRELRSQGVTVIVTTHYMDEAEQICDRLLIMDHGRIISEGTPRSLIERHAGSQVIEIVPEPPDEAMLAAELGECKVQRLGEKYEVFTDNCPQTIERLRAAVRLRSYGVRRATLEDVFIRLTGRELRD